MPRSRFRLLLALLVIVALGPFGAAASTAASDGSFASSSACDRPDEIRLDYYLLRDVHGQLALSSLAPSAANATTWTVEVDAINGSAQRSGVLEFPLPDYLMDEDVPVSGAVRASAERSAVHPVGGLPPAFSRATFEVRLVEGERATRLAQAHLSSSPRTIELKGDYPGHGKEGAPHTHGAGDDADRGLFLSDLKAELRFEVETWSPTGAPPALLAESWEFRVEIDGRSFLHMHAQGEAGPADRTEELSWDESDANGSYDGSPEPLSGWVDRAQAPALGPMLGVLAVGGTLGLVGLQRRRTSR